MQRREALSWLARGAALGGVALASASARAGGMVRQQIADNPSAAPELKPDDNILGEADAPVTVIEYASLTCPHCAHFSATTFPKIKSELIDTGKLRWVYRDFPLDKLALHGSLLAHCMPKEQYFATIEVLFASQGDWAAAADPDTALSQIGRTAGLDADTIKKCLSDKTEIDKIVAGIQEAEQKFDVKSTPTFIIGGKPYAGDMEYDAFYNLIKDQLPKS